MNNRMKSELNFKSLVLITNQLPFVNFMRRFVIYCENLTLHASQKWNLLPKQNGYYCRNPRSEIINCCYRNA